MSEPFIGQIQTFGFTFPPRGWAFCDGQLLPISQHAALFSLLGTTYGGDGRTTLALPDLRGRLPMHTGTGVGLSPRSLGARSGSERHTLTTNEMPAHSHDLRATSAVGDETSPVGAIPATANDGESNYANPAGTETATASLNQGG